MPVSEGTGIGINVAIGVATGPTGFALIDFLGVWEGMNSKVYFATGSGVVIDIA
jgi:hypothetical protein